ncbi:MAG: ACT domain-containing protein [Candidatus Jordarchaeales archaeon]
MDCLKQGVVNFSALAESIKDQVAALCGRKSVNVDSIKMALMRYAEELRRKRQTVEQQISKILERSILELKNDVAVLTISYSSFPIYIDKIVKLVESSRFLQVTQGTSAFTVVTDLKTKSKIIELLDKKSIIEILEDQSAIIIISPPQIIEVPGVISYITDLLAGNNVNITQIISCYTDTILIVKRSESLRAYKILEDRILLLRKLASQFGEAL